MPTLHALIEELNQMTEDGTLKFKDLFAFVESQRKKQQQAKPRRTKRTYRIRDGALFWEERYPGHGEAVMSLLAPLIRWKPELATVAPHLQDRTRNAIFWRETSGVETVSVARAGTVIRGLRETVAASLKTRFRTPASIPLQDSLRASLKDVFSGFGSAEQRRSGDLRHSLSGLIRDRHVLSIDESMKIEQCMYSMVWSAIIYPVRLMIEGRSEEASRFKPLHELLSAGNYPLSFDASDKCIVLVA